MNALIRQLGDAGWHELLDDGEVKLWPDRSEPGRNWVKRVIALPGHPENHWFDCLWARWLLRPRARVLSP